MSRITQLSDSVAQCLSDRRAAHASQRKAALEVAAERERSRSEGNSERSGEAAVCLHSNGRRWVAGALGEAGSCVRPGRVVCVDCGHWSPVRCNSGSRRKCEPCASLKAGDLASIARSGMMELEGRDSRRGALFAMVTLTAPGADVLGWDTSKCTHPRAEAVAGVAPAAACSGALGCQADAASVAAWEAGLPKRWSYFRQSLRRSLGAGVDVQFFKTYEEQRRGVLHVHALVRVEGVCSKRRFRSAVRSYRDAQGFGRQYDVSHVNGNDLREIARAAGYLAKYVTKAYDAETTVATVKDDAVGWHPPMIAVCVRRRAVRAWSASRGWGETMHETRERRVSYCRAGNSAGAPAPPSLASRAPQAPLDLYPNFSTGGLDTERSDHAMVASGGPSGVVP